MELSLIFTVSLILLDLLQAYKFPEEICIKDDYNNRHSYSREMERVCKRLKILSDESVYVAQDYVQLFINLPVFGPWNSEARILSGNAYPEYVTESTQNQSGRFMKVGAFGKYGKLKRVSASFLHFSDCINEFGYLISGYNAHEFVIQERFYWPSGKVRLITDFFKEGEQKLLMPEDKLDKVVSVALIKWVEKDKIKDHGLYKMILKTVTKKLVKSYFKVSSKGEVISLNSTPFVPSIAVMDDENELELQEESALYYVREKDKLSMGYQFIKSLAFPIYFDYNPEANTYKEYPMRTKEGFNAELHKLAHKIPYWNRYIVPTETWLGCPETTFCLGRSFDAVFLYENRNYAVYGNLVYPLKTSTSKPSSGEPLARYFKQTCSVDAAFSLGKRLYFIKDDIVYFKTRIGSADFGFQFAHVFSGIDPASRFPVSAVIALDKVKKAGQVTDKKPEPSNLKSGRQGMYQSIDERSAPKTETDILEMMVYVYISTKDGGSVYQFELVNKHQQIFRLIAKKPFKEVNEALPKSVSLVFTTEDKVVTMVNHFMIEQNIQTFFNQTENKAKFTLVNKYFGCNIENVEKELSKDFVQEYIKFAGPKKDADVQPDLIEARKRTDPQVQTVPPVSTPEDHCPKSIYIPPKDSETVPSTEATTTSTQRTLGKSSVKLGSSAMSAQISSAAIFVMQAVVAITFAFILL